MKLISIDSRHKRMRDPIEGVSAAGVFTYKTGGLPLLGWGAKEHTLNISAATSITDMKGQECIYMWFDGKDYSPIKMGDFNSVDKSLKSIQDLINSTKLSELTKKAMISQPRNTIADLLNILQIILVISLLAVGGYYVQAVGNTTKPLVKAYNASVTAQSNFDRNQSAFDNAVFAYIKASHPATGSNFTNIGVAPAP